MQQVDLFLRRRVCLLLFICALGFLVPACSTYYGPYSFWHDGGYTDVQLAPDTWRITYRLDDEGGQTYDLALVRAASLCKRSGYQWFKVERSHEQTVSHVQSYPTIEYDPFWDYAYPEREINTYTSTTSSIVVTGLKSKIPGALNCDYILSSVAQVYRISGQDLR